MRRPEARSSTHNALLQPLAAEMPSRALRLVRLLEASQHRSLP
jgi:hypothetical protein